MAVFGIQPNLPSTSTSTITYASHIRLVGTEDTTSQTSSADVGPVLDQQHSQHWQYAAALDPWVDSNRYWAGNDDTWDYAQGNPINPIHQGQDISLRPNNTVYTFVRFRGTHLLVVSYSDDSIRFMDVDRPVS